jgi:hypothetical protein
VFSKVGEAISQPVADRTTTGVAECKGLRKGDACLFRGCLGGSLGVAVRACIVRGGEENSSQYLC